jgi:HEAT repeat protein
LEKLEPAGRSNNPATGFSAFMEDPELCELLRDQEARQKVAAGLLPPLCLALLDQKPAVRVAAAFRLMALGPDAQSALGALRDALKDPDERVRKAAAIALEHIQNAQESLWF